MQTCKDELNTGKVCVFDETAHTNETTENEGLVIGLKDFLQDTPESIFDGNFKPQRLQVFEAFDMNFFDKSSQIRLIEYSQTVVDTGGTVAFVFFIAFDKLEGSIKEIT